MSIKKYIIIIFVLLSICCNNRYDLNYYKQILSLKKIQFSNVESFIIIEEYTENEEVKNSTRKGIVICNTKNGSETYTYSVKNDNKNTLELSDEFNDNSSIHYNERAFIFQLAVTDLKLLYKLEKINPSKKGKLNYTIASYDKEKNTSLKIINLYDVVIKQNN